jgi:tetratricopeptide (TPR) repeat protein
VSAHLTDAQLSDYLADRDAYPEVDKHLAECGECRDALDVLAAFNADMDAAMVWEFIVIADRRAAEVPKTLREVAEQLETEAREARDHLQAVVLDPDGLRLAAIAETEAMHTAGVVRMLCTVSRDLRERNPKQALALANEAVAVAECLPAGRYSQSLRGELRASAWLERANVQRYLGDFTEALRSLDQAEAEYLAVPLSDHPLAMVKYVRSVIFMKSERVSEAAKLAEESARVFRLYGDEERVVHAQLVMGVCLVYSGNALLARDLFRRLLPLARTLGEPATIARCLSNLANVEVDAGELGQASDHFAEAAEFYERLGLRTEVLRARWGHALLVLRMGNIDGGVARLRATAGEMLAIGLTNDHALVMLDMVAALFAIDERKALPAICARLESVFREAGMPENARTALAYLNAAMQSGTVSEPLIEDVKKYIEREDYSTPFVPPPA